MEAGVFVQVFIARRGVAHAGAGLEQAGQVAQFIDGVAQVLEHVVGIDAVETQTCQFFGPGDEARLLLCRLRGFVGGDVPALRAQQFDGARPCAGTVVEVVAAGLGVEGVEGADFLVGGVAFGEDAVVPVVFGGEFCGVEFENFGGAEDDVARRALVAQQTATTELALGFKGFEVVRLRGVAAQGAAQGVRGGLLAAPVVHQAPMAGDLVQQQAGSVHGSGGGFRRWCGGGLRRLWHSGWQLRRHGAARCGTSERTQRRGDAP